MDDLDTRIHKGDGQIYCEYMTGIYALVTCNLGPHPGVGGG